MESTTWREDRKRSRDDHDLSAKDGPSRLKRGRYSDPGQKEKDPESELESLIMRVGEKSSYSLENHLERLAETLCMELADFKDKILKTICKCAGELSEKTTIYSTLVGILNTRKMEVGEELLDLLFEDLKAALAMNQFQKAQNLVRFLADLVCVKVVTTSSIMSLFDTFLTITYEPGIPQVRSDWYTLIVLSALPWVARELYSKKPNDLDRLLSTVDSYMRKRQTAYLAGFQVWRLDRPYPQRDHLELLWTQLLNMKTEEWKESIIIRPYVALDSQISAAIPHHLPSIIVPSHSLDSHYPLPSALYKCFGREELPHHSNIQLLPVESIEQYLAEEMVRCVILSHSSNRKQCAGQLNSLAERLQHLPMEYIITEVLFGFILYLPSPPHPVVYYGSLFIELFKLKPGSYPALLTQTTNMFFDRLDRMNFAAASRLAWWFSYHLSNFQFRWDWNQWLWCLQCPPDHPSRWFVQEVFSRCVRLASYEVFVDFVPDSFFTLLPPAPQPCFAYAEEEDMDTSSSQSVIAAASQLVEAIRSKRPVEELLQVLESSTAHLPDIQGDDEKLLQTRVSILTQCVLHVGEKTVSHCLLALHKFKSLFVELLETGEAKKMCCQAVADFFTRNSQVHVLVLDKMVRLQILDNLSIVKWAVAPSNSEQFTTRLIWDALHSAVKRSKKSIQMIDKELAESTEALRRLSGLDEMAGGGEEKEELEEEVRVLEKRQREYELAQRELFITICQSLVSLLGQHLNQCDQDAEDYETTWFLCVQDNLRHLLFENHAVVSQLSEVLESSVFTVDVDSRILEVFQQFQALL